MIIFTKKLFFFLFYLISSLLCFVLDRDELLACDMNGLSRNRILVSISSPLLQHKKKKFNEKHKSLIYHKNFSSIDAGKDRVETLVVGTIIDPFE